MIEPTAGYNVTRAVQDMRSALCTDNADSSADVLRTAISAGGKQAQAALTIIAFLDCPDNDSGTIRKGFQNAMAPE